MTQKIAIPKMVVKAVDYIFAAAIIAAAIFLSVAGVALVLGFCTWVITLVVKWTWGA